MYSVWANLAERWLLESYVTPMQSKNIYAYSLVCSAGQRGTSLGGHTCFILCPCMCLCNVVVLFNLCNGSCCLSVPVVASTVCICLIGQTAPALYSCIALPQDGQYVCNVFVLLLLSLLFNTAVQFVQLFVLHWSSLNLLDWTGSWHFNPPLMYSLSLRFSILVQCVCVVVIVIVIQHRCPICTIICVALVQSTFA